MSDLVGCRLFCKTSQSISQLLTHIIIIMNNNISSFADRKCINMSVLI